MNHTNAKLAASSIAEYLLGRQGQELLAKLRQRSLVIPLAQLGIITEHEHNWKRVAALDCTGQILILTVRQDVLFDTVVEMEAVADQPKMTISDVVSSIWRQSKTEPDLLTRLEIAATKVLKMHDLPDLSEAKINYIRKLEQYFAQIRISDMSRDRIKRFGIVARVANLVPEGATERVATACLVVSDTNWSLLAVEVFQQYQLKSDPPTGPFCKVPAMFLVPGTAARLKKYHIIELCDPMTLPW